MTFIFEVLYIISEKKNEPGSAFFVSLRSCSFRTLSITNPITNPNPNPCTGPKCTKMTKNLHACFSPCSIPEAF